ncbi:MAG: septation protein SepH [Angustibacter sp.]
MDDLRLVGVHEDGDHLVLADDDGRRHLLLVDEVLRAAVRRDRAHLGQLQIEIGGQLRPREVQARVRAGATAEEVAAATGWPVQKVRRYEGPVLAERAHVAEQAKQVQLRRRASEHVSLGEEVARRLANRGVDPVTVVWDSWRPDDGPWTVCLSFQAGGRSRQARWQLDLATRSVSPSDDEARWLSEQVPDVDDPWGLWDPATSSTAAGVHHLHGGVARADDPSDTPVRMAHTDQSPTADVHLDHAPTPDAQADGTPAGAVGGDGDPLDLMSAMRTRRQQRSNTGRRARATRSGAPDLSQNPTPPLDEEPGIRHPSRRRRGTPADEQTRTQPAGGTWPYELEVADPSDSSTIDLTDRAPTASQFPPSGQTPDEDSPQEPAPEPRSRSRRASVPSWDDIMFGTRKD